MYAQQDYAFSCVGLCTYVCMYVYVYIHVYFDKNRLFSALPLENLLLSVI